MFGIEPTKVAPRGPSSSRDSLNAISGPALVPSFAPSRGRGLPALAATAVSGTQPAGRALPSLIFGRPDSADEHVRAACAASPLASLINLALPMRVENPLSAHVPDPSGTTERRPRALETFRDVDDKLSHRGEAWSRRLGPDSPARNINLPLLHLPARRFDYVGHSIVNDVAAGMPISGDIPP